MDAVAPSRPADSDTARCLRSLEPGVREDRTGDPERHRKQRSSSK